MNNVNNNNRTTETISAAYPQPASAPTPEPFYFRDERLAEVKNKAEFAARVERALDEQLDEEFARRFERDLNRFERVRKVRIERETEAHAAEVAAIKEAEQECTENRAHVNRERAKAATAGFGLASALTLISTPWGRKALRFVLLGR